MLPKELRQLHSKFRGCLLGSALGDAFGRPFEGAVLSNRASLLRQLKVRAKHRRPWQISDDTQMLLDLGHSLLRCGQFQSADFLKELKANYDPVLGYGKGMKLIFQAMDRGQDPETLHKVAWSEGSRGNGGVVRLPPLACFYHLNDHALLTQAQAACHCSHAHAEALAASRLFVRALDWLFNARKFSVPEFLSVLQQEVAPKSILAEKLQIIRQGLSKKQPTQAVVKALGHASLASESLPAALYAFCVKPQSVVDSIVFAVSLAGDTDSIAAMAGALAGARHGDDNIPELWLENIDHEHGRLEDVSTLADQIFNHWLARITGDVWL